MNWSWTLLGSSILIPKYNLKISLWVSINCCQEFLLSGIFVWIVSIWFFFPSQSSIPKDKGCGKQCCRDLGYSTWAGKTCQGPTWSLLQVQLGQAPSLSRSGYAGPPKWYWGLTSNLHSHKCMHMYVRKDFPDTNWPSLIPLHKLSLTVYVESCSLQ